MMILFLVCFFGTLFVAVVGGFSLFIWKEGRRIDTWGWAGPDWSFYIHWRHWAWDKSVRLNGTLMGYNPYTSYRCGPFDFRIFNS